MKRILYFIAAILCLAGCSDRMPVGHDIPSKVYLLHPGEQYLTVTSETEYAKVWICKAGYDSKSYSFDVVIDEEDAVRYSMQYKKTYQMLPGNSYTLATPVVTLNSGEYKTSVRIDIDPACITKGVTFILPVRVTCSDPDSFKGDNMEYLLIKK
jgi:hypothetical protein